MIDERQRLWGARGREATASNNKRAGPMDTDNLQNTQSPTVSYCETCTKKKKNTSICTEKSYVNERGSALENRQQQQRERATTSSRKAPGGEARSPAGRARVIISSHRATQRKREREKVVLEQQRLDLHSRQSNQEE